ncbi:uncharacterized protein LOC132722980, partial [Ruditapes philippinarum]|uniref:uncharacterized protein LOC132722980 n=1 Tax=Ruditapes philippinarum TaxID=129788 RepID=UPI00295ADA71
STVEALSHLPYDASAAEWTVMVAHHLLSKLTVSSTYLLDSESTEEPWKKDRTCPCGCNKKINGAFGDTSLGVPSHWHGRVDILTDVAVKIIVPEEPESDDAGNRSTKIKMGAYRDEIRAGAIVYSFLMRKKHPELDNFLIPTVVMSKTHIAVVFYDCENDILLETPLLSLFQQGNDVILSKSTILILWLALNFKYCCSGVPDGIIDTGYKANFFKHTGSVLESYREDVIAPCDYVATFDWFVLPVFETLPLKK